jgi:carbamoyltransferase
MKELINAKVKFREPFRPFAPSVLEEAANDFFHCSRGAPFMTEVYAVRPEQRSVIPAVTHVDGTARLQTVSKTVNPLYWRLIRRFGDLTGVPVVLNTSLNVKGEPIVNTPAEAVDMFLKTGLDALVCGNWVVLKEST